MDWRPCADLASLKFRAALLTQIRQFFHARDVWEVDTPSLARYGVTDPALHNLAVTGTFGHRLLQTSPEYHMKRLLAAGSGSIYQIAHAFRDDESGRRHEPEFTLLEWYRVGFDHHQLMREVETLVQELAHDVVPLGNSEHYTYQTLFQTYLGIDPFTQSAHALRQLGEHHGLHLVNADVMCDKDVWLDLLLSHLIEPKLGQQGLCFITDYPISQAALAKVRHAAPPVAERFEVYWQGLELANGFHELTDANEQQQRFEQDNIEAKALGLPERPIDPSLLHALSAGLPACAGVALGLDRLLMSLLKQEDIAHVMAFPQANA